LLKDMKKYRVLACVHGRPAIKGINLEELRKFFNRP